MPSKVKISTMNNVEYISVLSPVSNTIIHLPFSLGNYMWDGRTACPTITPEIHVPAQDGIVAEHFKVQNGVINYFEDCDHSGALSTVDMVDVVDWSTDREVMLCPITLNSSE